MKIIISPSKTMKMSRSKYLMDKQLLFLEKHKEVLAKLRKLTKTSLGISLSIKGNLLNQTYDLIKNYNTLDEYHAFESYTGLVYKHLDRDNYQTEAYDYITKHLRILDALYGVLEPGTLIKQYRLDMKSKIGLNLYKHWNIERYFNDEIIINLASNEFSTMLNRKMINIKFLQKNNDKYLNLATYAKMARGIFLDFLIKNKITDIRKMKTFNLDNYKYEKSLSDELNIVFVR